MGMSHDQRHVTSRRRTGGWWPTSRFNADFVQWMFIIDSLIFLLNQFSRSKLVTCFIGHRCLVFCLCSLMADRGWQQDRCSLNLVPGSSVLAVPPD